MREYKKPESDIMLQKAVCQKKEEKKEYEIDGYIEIKRACPSPDVVIRQMVQEGLGIGFLNSEDDKERMDAVVKVAAFFQEIYKDQLQELLSILEVDSEDTNLVGIQTILKDVIPYICAKNIADNDLSPEVRRAITKFSSEQQKEFMQYFREFTKDSPLSFEKYKKIAEIIEKAVVSEKQEKVGEETWKEFVSNEIASGVLTQDEGAKIMDYVLGKNAADDHPL